MYRTILFHFYFRLSPQVMSLRSILRQPPEWPADIQRCSLTCHMALAEWSGVESIMPRVPDFSPVLPLFPSQSRRRSSLEAPYLYHGREVSSASLTYRLFSTVRESECWANSISSSSLSLKCILWSFVRASRFPGCHHTIYHGFLGILARLPPRMRFLRT